MFSKALAVLLISLSFGRMAQSADIGAAYRKDFLKWKQELTNDRKQNWLTLVGLFWLQEGANQVGGNPKLEIPLPQDKVAPHIGVIDFHAGKAVFKADPGTKVTSNGKLVTTIELVPDVSGNPTVLAIGDIRMLLIQRGQKFGMRVRDVHSSALQRFTGLKFYPLSRRYIVKAKFIPFDKPKQVAIPTVLGQDAQMDSPGIVEFTLDGQKEHLQALSETPGELFFILRDKTAGHGTYPAGRFLYTQLPKKGTVVLDFNKAHNPPCAFTPYATCPLPPKENYMTVKVEAGEMYQGHH
jgi:uncharacterized protein (DUF1684 family)